MMLDADVVAGAESSGIAAEVEREALEERDRL
jgi:hypothetical protein